MDKNAELILTVDCPRCGRVGQQADTKNPHLCVECVKVDNSRYSHIRNHQENWIEIATESGLNVWDRQPGETQWEYTVWLAYRDAYPGKKPSYGDVARQLAITVNAVQKAAQRWSFQARMQAWIAECDRITLAQRYHEILSMNAQYISIGDKLRNKIETAVEHIEPALLKPGEIATLLKTASDIERKARIDTISQDELIGALSKDVDNPNLRKSTTTKDDLGDVVKILAEAGVLGNITQIGVRQTTTTEVVAQTEDS